jgi:transposase
MVPSRPLSRCLGRTGKLWGQITRIKPVSRQMFGRGKLDLLQARLLGAAS